MLPHFDADRAPLHDASLQWPSDLAITRHIPPGPCGTCMPFTRSHHRGAVSVPCCHVTLPLKGDGIDAYDRRVPISRWNGQPNCRAVPEGLAVFLGGENQVGRSFTAPCVLWSICVLRVGGRCLPTGLVARRIPPLTSRRYFRAPTAQLIVSVGSLGCNQDRFAFAARESCGTTSIENVFALRRETLG